MFRGLWRLMLLPFSVASAWSQTLTNGDWVYRTNASNEATITAYLGTAEHVSIPEQLGGSSVRQIGNGRPPIFGWSNSIVKSVVIPSTVRVLGSQAFANCLALTNLHLPGSVTNIAASALSGCWNLPAITVDESNPSFTSIEGVLFNRALNFLVAYPPGRLGSYTVPSSVQAISSGAFAGSTHLTSVFIGAGITNLSSSMFSRCTSLVAVEVDAANSYFSSVGGVVYNKAHSEIVVYPSGKAGFYVVREGVTSIQDRAFQYAAGLSGVLLPSTLTNLGSFAFLGASSLREVVIPSGVTTIKSGVFSGCSEITNVVIPINVTNIDSSAFASCRSLKHIAFPDNVGRIGSSVFMGCSNLASVIMGSNVTNIHSNAFYYAENLTSILFRGSAPADSSWAGELPTNSTIYYLPGASGWPASYGSRSTQVFEPAAAESAFALTTGFQFSWTNTGSIPMNVRRTTSLGGPWTVVSTNNSTGQFIDPNPPSGKAFYQAYLP
jgi:hypothetical protein